MVEPGTGLTVLGSAPIVLKILGPTADYVGNGLQGWAERRAENVREIFSRAQAKLGEEGLNKEGAVPPRVLKQILEDGSYCDDELGAEYFGGILASSKSLSPRDDRGATLAGLVGRLSQYQLRCHYVMYAHARRLLRGANFNLGIAKDRREHGTIFIPWPVWIAGMELDVDEQGRRLEIVEHSLAGLAREDLINGQSMRWGAGDFLQLAKPGKTFPESGGIVFGVSLLGIELFTQAHGIVGTPKLTFLAPDLNFDVEANVEIGDGSAKIADLPGKSAAKSLPGS